MARPDALELAQLQASGVDLQDPSLQPDMPLPLAPPVLIGNESWSEGFRRIIDEWTYNNFTNGSEQQHFERPPFKSEIHKEASENYEYHFLKPMGDFEGNSLRKEQFTPMGFVLLRQKEYDHFIANQELTFDFMKDYDFINIWPSTADALLQKAYLEASRFALFSADRYIVLGVCFNSAKLREDLRGLKASTFERYGGSSISLAIHRDRGHRFTKDEMTIHEATVFTIQSPGELRDMKLAKTVFNHFQACFSLGFGFERPSSHVHCNIFIFYDINCWLHYGSTLNEDEAIRFIRGFIRLGSDEARLRLHRGSPSADPVGERVPLQSVVPQPEHDLQRVPEGRDFMD